MRRWYEEDCALLITLHPGMKLISRHASEEMCMRKKRGNMYPTRGLFSDSKSSNYNKTSSLAIQGPCKTRPIEGNAKDWGEIRYMQEIELESEPYFLTGYK